MSTKEFLTLLGKNGRTGEETAALKAEIERVTDIVRSRNKVKKNN